MRKPDIFEDYNEMIRLHEEMEQYKRDNCGRPSLVLRVKLNILLAPYADQDAFRHAAER